MRKFCLLCSSYCTSKPSSRTHKRGNQGWTSTFALLPCCSCALFSYFYSHSNKNKKPCFLIFIRIQIRIKSPVARYCICFYSFFILFLFLFLFFFVWPLGHRLEVKAKNKNRMKIELLPVSYISPHMRWKRERTRCAKANKMREAALPRLTSGASKCSCKGKSEGAPHKQG